METLFRKVLVSERVPTGHNAHFTNKGELHLIGGKWCTWWQGDQFIETTDVEWFLEEIQLPGDKEIDHLSNIYYFNLEEKSEKAKNCRGQITGRHPDLLTSRELFAIKSGYADGLKELKDYILGFINNKK